MDKWNQPTYSALLLCLEYIYHRVKYICLNISDHACWNHCKKFLIDLKISFSAFICLMVITVTIFLLFNILQRVTTFWMKKDLRRNPFIYDMENRDLLVYASIKLIKVFIVYNLLRICKNNFGHKNYGK